MFEQHNIQSDETGTKPLSEPVRLVLDTLAKLKYGAIQLTVHDGKLVQVDVTERQRFSH
jgi:hypothetical protein